MAYSLPEITPARVQSAFTRIPLATKGIVLIILLFYFSSFSFDLQSWAQLAPDKVFSGGAHRLSTYPFLHLGLFHTLVNVIALLPLLEKFEEENGTLTTVLLFFGPFSTFPGLIYTVICLLLHLKSPVQGASVWSFLLFSATIYKASQTTPQLSIPSTTQKLPTLAVPILVILVTSFLIPHTSLLGHLCGMVIGYGWGSGLLKFLAPPEKILRWVEDKLRLRARLPSSYVSVDKGSYGRYGLNDLPTNSAAPNGILGGTGESGIRLGV